MAESGVTEANFTRRLEGYQARVNSAINGYIEREREDLAQGHGDVNDFVAESYLDLLSRGNRVRGVLTIAGYEMAGGMNEGFIDEAALAVEIPQTSMVAIDDVQDESNKRRGGDAIHKLISEEFEHIGWHEDRMNRDSQNTASNSGHSRIHKAARIILSLNVDPSITVQAIDKFHEIMEKTGEGQNRDLYLSGRIEPASYEEIIESMREKTGLYTVLGPLQIGIILADGSPIGVHLIEDFALNAGIAFQIANDLKIVRKTGDDAADSAKPDDIQGNKQTLLTHYALMNAELADAQFLMGTLGKQDLTGEELAECQRIFIESGAVDFARGEMEMYMTQALDALHAQAHRWTPDGVQFLAFLSKQLIKNAGSSERPA